MKMKYKLFVGLISSIGAICGTAHGAITVSIKNFTSASAGNPIVSNGGVPLPLNSIYASAGIFTAIPDWATATPVQILALFTPIDDTPVSNSTFNGVFSANDTSTLPAYAPGFDGGEAYIVVGNNAVLANSTLIAVYHTPGQVFATPVVGIANTPINATATANWLFGLPVAVSQQTTIPGSAYTTGILLVPEPAVGLLGALGVFGLLRRRR